MRIQCLARDTHTAMSGGRTMTYEKLVYTAAGALWATTKATPVSFEASSGGVKPFAPLLVTYEPTAETTDFINGTFDAFSEVASILEMSSAEAGAFRWLSHQCIQTYEPNYDVRGAPFQATGKWVRAYTFPFTELLGFIDEAINENRTLDILPYPPTENSDTTLNHIEIPILNIEDRAEILDDRRLRIDAANSAGPVFDVPEGVTLPANWKFHRDPRRFVAGARTGSKLDALEILSRK